MDNNGGTPTPLPPLLCALSLVLNDNDDLGKISWFYPRFRKHRLCDPIYRDKSVDPRGRYPDNLDELLPAKRHWWDRIRTIPQDPQPHSGAVSSQPAPGNDDIVMAQPDEEENNDLGNDELLAPPQVAIAKKRSSVSQMFFFFFCFKFFLKRQRRASVKAANQEGAEISTEPVGPTKVSECSSSRLILTLYSPSASPKVRGRGRGRPGRGRGGGKGKGKGRQRDRSPALKKARTVSAMSSREPLNRNSDADDPDFAGRRSVSSRGRPGRDGSSLGTGPLSNVDFTVRIVYYFNILKLM